MGEEEIWAGRSWEATWRDNKPRAPPLHVKLWWPATNSLLTPLTVLAAGVGIKKLCLYVNKKFHFPFQWTCLLYTSPSPRD